ncbi:MAG: hypothetical protein AB2777_22565 [Candidatus Thiodiazotropha endolucinida]
MDIKQALAITLATSLTLGTPTLTQARNCIKGKPCGKGCIALNKTCRIDTDPGSNDNTLRYSPRAQPGAIIRRTKLRMPKLHMVTTTSIQAAEAPNSNRIGSLYKRGQRVFVYETYEAWARISNMQPEEWIELKYLRTIGK